ncbi:MAG: iron ABC transporter permease [Treponema sp.]|jgi:iron complex transport system permease protein|nr:iron ABC transporter permease [Treponema sp.]
MKRPEKFTAGIVLSLAILCAGSSLGSTSIGFLDTLNIAFHKIANLPLRAGIDPKNVTIVWNLRFPRALLAFLTGSALSISGTVFQSTLKNPLASPYIIGVSSGASLGAALVILTGLRLPFAGGFTLPFAGFLFALATVLFVLFFTAKIDKNFSNNTIILFGMVFSLFVNALLMILVVLYREQLRNLLYWQMGSFSLKGWDYVILLLPFLALGSLGAARHAREMDILTFGEDQAKSLGVDAEKVRLRLLFYAAILTGAAVALAGAIGFVDLIAPHLARKIVGARHRYTLPMAAILGGSLMVTADLIARTILSPSELPVGAVTAILGAPFFAWVYFRKR